MKNSDDVVFEASLRRVGHDAAVAGCAIEALWIADMSFLEKAGLVS